MGGSEELSDKMNLRRLLKSMYTDDKFEGMEEFSEILSSLSPELVSSIALNRYGSLLCNAVMDDKIDFIRLLLEKGVDPNIKDSYHTYNTSYEGDTPMQIASKRDSVELLSLFNKYAMNPPSMTIKLLKLIIESGRSLDAFKKHLKKVSASEVDQIDTSGNTSSRGGYSMDGNLPHFAVVKNLKEHVRILLEHGCDPKAPMVAHFHQSPLEMAIINGQMDFWNIMREGTELTENEKLVQLQRMIVDGKMDQDNPCKEFKELLSSLPIEMVSTTSIEFIDHRFPRNTLLQVAAARPNNGVIRLLLEKGVDPTARGDNGKTAMEVATEYMSNIDRDVSEEVLNFLCGPIGEESP